MTEPIKILFVETGEAGGGSFQSLYNLLLYIDKSRISPVVAFTNSTHWDERYIKLGIPVYKLKSIIHSKSSSIVLRKLSRKIEKLSKYSQIVYKILARFLYKRLVRELSNIIKDHKIDVLYDNDQINRNLFMTELARHVRLPLISHLRSLSFEDFDHNRANIANRYVTAFIANSHVVKKLWHEKGVNQKKIYVVHNAIDPARAEKASLRDRFGFAHEHVVLIAVARLVAWKRLDILLHAVAKISPKFPNLRVLIVGDGAMRAELESLSCNLSIDGICTFAGWQTDAPSLIASSNLLVLPSESEPFGLVLLEAMRENIPVIGAHAGGIPEIINPNVNGLLFTSGDAESLAKCIGSILSDSLLRDKLVQSASHIVQEYFTPGRYVLQIEDVITDAYKKTQF